MLNYQRVSLSPWDSSLHLTVNPLIFSWCLCFHRPENLAAQRECDDGAMVRMPGLEKKDLSENLDHGC